MIEVRDIHEAILFNLNEMYNRKHSDPELIEAINAVLRVMNMILVNRDSNWVVKEAKVKTKDGKARLPGDFVKMKDIYITQNGETTVFEGEYRIVRDTIYIADFGTMDYYFALPMVESLDDTIDLPSICRIVKHIGQRTRWEKASEGVS